MSRERGFTLVEVMVSLTIFLVVIAIVFQVYVKAVQFNAYFAAKDDILTAMNTFAAQVNKYTDGAGAIFTVSGDSLVPMNNWPDTATLDNIAFCTMRLGTYGEDVTSLVYIYNEPVKDDAGVQLYFKDEIDGGICKPLNKIIIKIYDTSYKDCSNAVNLLQEQFDNNWVNAREITFKPNVIDSENSFSYMYFRYRKYYVNPNIDETITWPSLSMKSVFGVLRNIYDDSTCTHRVRGYAVDVYPYEQIFNVYGRNMEKER